jgi:hypothetical protein
MISILLQNWKLVLIGALLLVLAGSGLYVSHLKGNIDTLVAEKEALDIKLQVSNASIAALQAAINEQNAAVEKFKADAELRSKAAQDRIAKARIESANQKKKATDIMGRAIPKDSTACDAANQLFNEEIRNAK